MHATHPQALSFAGQHQGEWLETFASWFGLTPARLDLFARQTEALTRQRKVRTGPELFRLCVLYSCSASWSLRTTAAVATSFLDTSHFSGEALRQRLIAAPAFFERILAFILELDSLDDSPRARVRLVDSSTLQRSGVHGTDFRLHLEITLGGWPTYIELTDAKGAEGLARTAPTDAPHLVIGDRNYCRGKALCDYLQRHPEGAVAVRAHPSQVRFETRHDGLYLCPERFLEHFNDAPAWRREARPPKWFEVDLCPGSAQESKGKPRTPMWLVVMPLEEEAAERARQAYLKRVKKRKKRKDGKAHQPKPVSLAMCDWFLVATNLGPDEIDAEDVLALYRLRWQIELTFKRYKSLTGLGELPTTGTPQTRTVILARIVVELMAEHVSNALTQDLERESAASPGSVSRWRVFTIAWHTLVAQLVADLFQRVLSRRLGTAIIERHRNRQLALEREHALLQKLAEVLEKRGRAP